MQLDQDDRLLRAFLDEGSEQAFCELVARHADVVARVVHKRVTQQESAQEIIQNVFSLLARKAHVLIKHPTIAGWLIKTAIFETRKYQRKEIARMRREAIHASLKEITAGQHCFQEADYQRVENALTELSAIHRDAVLMRYYQKASFFEIGARFGKSDDAAQKMVSRAVERLRRLLNDGQDQTRLGSAATVALLSGLFSAKSIALGATSSMALSALHSSSSVSKTTLLINTLYSTMTASQIKATVVVGLLVSLPLAYQWNEHRQKLEKQDVEAATLAPIGSQDKDGETNILRLDKDSSNRSNLEPDLKLPLNAPSIGQSAELNTVQEEDWASRRAKKLILDLSDEEWKIRRGAAALLNGSNVPAAIAVPALIEALHDEEWQVRKPVADALASYGVNAAEATQDLNLLLNDEEWHVRESAAFALSKIGPEAELAVPELAKALYDEEWHVRKVAAEALGAIGPSASSAVYDLIESLGDEEWQVRNPAAKALASIGADAALAVEVLELALNDEEWPVAVNASTALGNIGSPAVVSIPSLMDALEHQESQVREAAAIALRAIRHESIAVIDSLQLRITDPSPEVGRAAVEAIRSIEASN
ncbi:HEAT repeat domain-containing protein [bacterium]|nr:HEAT repeat domain-containing protein [bacterium]